jgi:hypothetical protein
MAISESRPWRSQAIGIQPTPDEIEEFNKSCKQRGVNGYYDPHTGEFVAHSRKARSEEFKHRGFIDRDAGYGDYAGE